MPHFVNLPKTLVKEFGPQRIAHSKFRLQLLNSNWGAIGSAMPYLISISVLLHCYLRDFFKDVDSWARIPIGLQYPLSMFWFKSSLVCFLANNSEGGVMSGESESQPLPKAEAKPKARVPRFRRPCSDWTEGGISMNSLMHQILDMI